MRRTLCCVGILALVAPLTALHAVENQYQSGKIVSVEKKVHTRVLYYIVDTPITRDDPYYQIAIRFGDQVCVGEYTPRHAADVPPQAWVPGSEVQVRLEKHHMLVKGGGGPDRDLVIVKRLQAPGDENAPDPASPKK
jgi:hypothetical protein